MKTRSVSRTPRIGNTVVVNCRIRLGLDTRHVREEGMPISIIYQIGTKKYYRHLSYKVSRPQFVEICNANGRGRPSSNPEKRPYDIKMDILKSFSDAVDRLRGRVGDSPLTMERLRKVVDGTVSSDDEAHSFTEFWEKVACSQLSLNTRDSYLQARKSFMRYVGEITGFVVTVDEVNKWDTGLKEDGRSKATRGIYLRSMRKVWKEAQRRGYISFSNYPFGKESEGRVSIPAGGSRKKQYLDVNKMTSLYNIFVNKDYPKEWSELEVASVHGGLGLFLLQYLCNGCNMADLARLRYDQSYFMPEGEQSICFQRQKTKERDIYDQVVSIPLIKPLATILEQVAAPAVEGELVFPQIYKGAVEDSDMQRNVAQMNQNVRKQLRKLTDSLGWKVNLSGSWARHSYATNLRHAGIDKDYISESMGHTLKKETVTWYIDIYPIAVQYDYNSKLLNLSSYSRLEKLTPKEYEMLLQFRSSNATI